MKKQFKDFNYLFKNDLFMHHYFIAIGVAIAIDWFMTPYFVKLMGLHVLVFFITIYYFTSKLGGYIEPYFRKTKIKTSFLILIFMDIIQFFCLFLFFYDITIFTYSIMVMFSLQNVLFEMYNLKTIEFFEKYRTMKISRLNSFLLFNETNMIVLGLSSSVIYSLFLEDYKYMIISIMFLMIISIYHEIKLYTYIKYIDKD